MSMLSVHTSFGTVLDLVREELARQLHEQLAANIITIDIVRVFPRPYSLTSVLEISTDRGKHRFVLKQIINHHLNASIYDEPNQAVIEHNILSQLYHNFVAVERCAVPRPVAVFPGIDGLLMEYFDGHELADDLRFVHYISNRMKFIELQNYFYDCGRWLRHFQQFTGQRLAGLSALDNILKHCHNRLRVIEESGDRRCPKYFRQCAADFIERQIQELTDVKFLVSGRHGDFGPWNTLVGPGGVTVIDFFGYREGPLPVDILSMLVYLESIRHGIANSGARIRALRERFLTGFGPLPEAPQPLVLLCEAQQRIIQIAGAVIAEKEGMFRRWERSRSLRAHVNWFLSRPQKSSLWPT